MRNQYNDYITSKEIGENGKQSSGLDLHLYNEEEGGWGALLHSSHNLVPSGLVSLISIKLLFRK